MGFLSVIAIAMRPTVGECSTISFASTLYLCPILDLLLAAIPPSWQAEVRLGLQEALVNAAKHGNNLDPSKQVLVRFSVKEGQYWWVISDQGTGFTPPCDCPADYTNALPDENEERGRGLCILHQIFDQVHWNSAGTELRLCKQVNQTTRQPLLR